MNKSSTKPILVTGSHRSGSTWVGDIISQSSDVGYIHEPFSLLHRPGLCDIAFRYWFTYICDENASQYIDSLSKCFQFKYNLVLDFQKFISIRDKYYSVRDFLTFNYHKIKGDRPLIKDPIAFFSTEWLAKTYNMDVVMLIRHPAAFAGSLKKIQWYHPFDHFLDQPLLMKHYLYKYRTKIEAIYKNSGDIIDHAILLWNIFHDTIIKYTDEHPEWIYKKHEDISMNPESEFKNIFETLGLTFSNKIKTKIINSSSSKQKSILKRDSRSNIWSWKRRLSEEEIERIYEGTNNISKSFYSDEDWS